MIAAREIFGQPEKKPEHIKAFVIDHIEGNWVRGRLWGTVKFWAKIYVEPSDYGIENGHVSKLECRTMIMKTRIVNYDRSWDIGEKTGEKVWRPLVAHLNKFAQSQRFKEALES